MVESIDAPPQDRFQIVTEHSTNDLMYSPAYLGVQRMAEILARNPGLRPQDLMINLVETAWENWSFGNGEAQYTK